MIDSEHIVCELIKDQKVEFCEIIEDQKIEKTVFCEIIEYQDDELIEDQKFEFCELIEDQKFEYNKDEVIEKDKKYVKIIRK